MAGVQSSGTSLAYPYGGISPRIAGQEANQLGPLLQGFGIGFDTPKQDRFNARLQNATGPLADLIRQVQAFAPGVAAQAEQIGQQTAARGEASYEALTNQINSSLAALPQFQAAANQGLGYAQQYAQQAFSPTQDQPLYQEASRRLLDTIRPGLAARGLEGGGAGQRAETDATRDLAFNFAQQKMGQEAQAIPQLQGAAQQGAQLSQAGIPIAGEGMQAVGQVAQLLQQQYGIPMQAIGSILQLLTSPQQGAQGLVQATAPIGLPSSKGTNIL